MIDFEGIRIGLYEPDFGALMARRSVLTLVDRFVRDGGTYARGFVETPRREGDRLTEIRLASGERIRADRFVFAAGPWLPKLFPEVIGPRILPTRQEIFYFAPPAGDRRFQPGAMPGWADFNGGDIFYGFPDLETRGVKFAHDAARRRGRSRHPEPPPDRSCAGRGHRLPRPAIPGYFAVRRSPAPKSASMRTARTAIS